MQETSSYKMKESRSTEKFANDILKCTNIEAKLMQIYVNWLNENKKSKHPYTFINHGIDNTGKYIEKRAKVTTKADFLLKHKSKQDRKIEIKFSRQITDIFHLKIKQLRDYIIDDVCLVNFIGTETAHPQFCILTPADMLNLFLNKKNQVVEFQPWDFKLCLRVKYPDVIWHTPKI